MNNTAELLRLRIIDIELAFYRTECERARATDEIISTLVLERTELRAALDLPRWAPLRVERPVRNPY